MCPVFCKIEAIFYTAISQIATMIGNPSFKVPAVFKEFFYFVLSAIIFLCQIDTYEDPQVISCLEVFFFIVNNAGPGFTIVGG